MFAKPRGKYQQFDNIIFVRSKVWWRLKYFFFSFLGFYKKKIDIAYYETTFFNQNVVFLFLV